MHEDLIEYNYKYYKSLEKYCEEYGICVSIENLFTSRCDPVLTNPYHMLKLIDKLNSKWFNVCCDVGHAAITGFEPSEVISVYSSDVLKALHIQDNDYKRDLHLLPYFSKINWDEIAESLSKIGYNGDFTFEIGSFFKRLPDELFLDALIFAQKTGRHIISKIK